MKIFRIATGSLTPTLDAALVAENGTLVDLTGSTVEFTLSDLGGAERFVRASTVVDAATGFVRYTWLAGDTATTGRYLGRFAVTFPSLDVQYYPAGKYIRVEVT